MTILDDELAWAKKWGHLTVKELTARCEKAEARVEELERDIADLKTYGHRGHQTELAARDKEITELRRLVNCYQMIENGKVDHAAQCLKAARDTLAAFGMQAGVVKGQDGYSVTMTTEERQLAEAVADIDRLIADWPKSEVHKNEFEVHELEPETNECLTCKIDEQETEILRLSESLDVHKKMLADRDAQLKALWHSTACPFEYCIRTSKDEPLLKSIRERLGPPTDMCSCEGEKE